MTHAPLTRFERVQIQLLHPEARSEIRAAAMSRLAEEPHAAVYEIIRTRTKDWNEAMEETLTACLTLIEPLPPTCPPVGAAAPADPLDEVHRMDPGLTIDMDLLSHSILPPHQAVEVQKVFCLIHQLVRLYGTRNPRS